VEILISELVKKKVEQFCFLNNDNLNCDFTLKIIQVWHESSASNIPVHTFPHCVDSGLHSNSGTAGMSPYQQITEAEDWIVLRYVAMLLLSL
jgi:hypothetical protein